MANNIIRRTWKQGGLVNIEDLRGSAFQAESGGHTFLISGVDIDGNPLALSGTPAGVLLRADGQDVTLTCSVSDGVVSATLPANAYVVPGRVGITIFLTSDGQKTAIYAAVGSVATTSTGTVAPPAGSDVVDLVNAIATAVATIPASYTDLMAAVAPTYSTSALYAVGSYAWYSGKLYRCTTAITSGETWTSAHWTQANLGSDVSDLKSAFNNKGLKFLAVTESTASSIYNKLASNLPGNTYCWVSGAWFTDIPTGLYFLFTLSEQAEYTRYAGQLAYQPETGVMYTRQKKSASGGYQWTSWSLFSDPGNSIVYKGILSSGTDFNDVVETGIYGVQNGNTYTHNPSWQTGGLLIVIAYSNSMIFQIATGASSFSVANRIKNSGTWTSWSSKSATMSDLTALESSILDVALHYNAVTEATAQSAYGKLAANLPGNTYSWISSTWFTDVPSGLYFIFTLAEENSYSRYAGQILFNPETGRKWSRQKKSAGGGTYAWTDWTTEVEGQQWVGKKWFAYGTSLTTEEQGHWVDETASALGLTATNRGYGGGGLVNNPEIYDRVMNDADGKADADIITLEFGANDRGTPLGNIDSMDTTKLFGAANTCIKHLLENCPKAQIIIMPSFLNRYEYQHPENEYTLNQQESGGWTREEFYEGIRKLAELNGVYYCPFGCNIIPYFRAHKKDQTTENGYDNTYIADQIHPTALGGYNIAQFMIQYIKKVPLWYTSIPS